MATQIDLDRKPSLPEWLAADPWFDGLLRDTLNAYREGHRSAHEETMLRFGRPTGPAGPQVKAS